VAAGTIHAAIVGALGYWVNSAAALIGLLILSVPLYGVILLALRAIPKEDRAIILRYVRDRLGIGRLPRKPASVD
jgi:hypothetical protein